MGLHQHDDPRTVLTPAQRLIENGHIFLWLIKDTCWVNEWKAGGIAMIAPTLIMAVYIFWRTRRVKAEFYHNLAICLWITGNSVWMLGEFFKTDTRHYTSLLFLTGLGCMLFYYCFILPGERRKRLAASAALSEEL